MGMKARAWHRVQLKAPASLRKRVLRDGAYLAIMTNDAVGTERSTIDELVEALESNACDSDSQFVELLKLDKRYIATEYGHYKLMELTQRARLTQIVRKPAPKRPEGAALKAGVIAEMTLGDVAQAIKKFHGGHVYSAHEVLRLLDLARKDVSAAETLLKEGKSTDAVADALGIDHDVVFYLGERRRRPSGERAARTLLAKSFGLKANLEADCPQIRRIIKAATEEDEDGYEFHMRG